nr:putative uncharacterized protein [uncultured bacterium]BAJ06955.1 putative uncharacterized protein [uncultured bacterium]
MTKPTIEPCVYCLASPGVEPDHVVARQFFPKDQRWRGGLPQVPSCGDCNRAKQRIEDNVGVWFQFGDGSEGSSRVLAERVPRTFLKNRRLARELREKTQEVWAPGSHGILVPASVLELGHREQSDAHSWFRFVTRGLYYHETGKPLPLSNSLFLIRPTTEDAYEFILSTLTSVQDRIARTYADGEFRYLLSHNAAQEISLWLIAFRSINVAAATVSPDETTLLRSALDRHAWKV